MIKEGRCSVITGNGPLIWDFALAKEFKTFAQLIELLESRGVPTCAATPDCLRREMIIFSPGTTEYWVTCAVRIFNSRAAFVSDEVLQF